MLKDYDFSLRRKHYKPSLKEDALINRVSFNKTDWTKKKFSGFKTNLKEYHLFKQKDRCAFCRKLIEADGYQEDIEHIVAKTRRKNWMFTVKNLVVTCRPCNRLKNADNTIAKPFRRNKKFPEDASAFTTFNPHFEKWSDHLKVKDIFLQAKPSSKGEETIRIYRLFRYHVCINISREKQIKKNSRNVDFVLDRVRKGGLSSEEKKHMDKALKYFKRRIK